MKNTRLAALLSLLLAPSCAAERAAAPVPLCAEPATAPLVSLTPLHDVAVEAVAVPGCSAAVGDAAPLRFDGGEVVPLCRDLAVEGALDLAARRRLAEIYAAARADVVAQMGERVAPDSLVVVCASEACRQHFAGTAGRSVVLVPGQRLAGARFTATRTTLVLVVADERARGTLAHETAHVELHARLGRGQVPAWFDEGLAALIGDEPRCSAGGARGVDDLRRLASRRAWGDYTDQPGTLIPTYCQARAEVDAWARRHGKDEVMRLVSRVRDGARFEDVYGAMLTQGESSPPLPLVSRAEALGDGARAFSIALWIRPNVQAGVIAHVSASDVGTGWCAPFLGFDGEKRLVAQMLVDKSEAPGRFAVARDLRPRQAGRWTHVAMTWAPEAPLRLYVGGALAAEAAAPIYAAPRAPVFVTWGSQNLGGAQCWPGATAGGAFAGAVTEPRVLDAALTAAEVAALARRAP